MMGNSIQDSGISNLKPRRVMACKFGLMVLNLRGSGKMIWPMATEDLFWQMEMYSKETG